MERRDRRDHLPGQVSTAADFSTGIVVDDSTLTTASKALNPLTNNTVYYWRINAKNAGGTSAWSTSSGFTTIVAAPGVPVLSAPADNATGIAVSPTVTWNAVTGAATYRVQVSTTSDFSTGIVVDDSTLTTASKAVGTLSNGTKYYWRVDAKNAGGASSWASSSFTTIVKFAFSISATNGTVTPNPAVSPYDSGTVVTLTPVSATGYQFAGWSGDLTGTANPATITMNSAKTVTASFAINTFNITASTGANGTISPNGAKLVNYGATQAYTISPATGYHVADVLVDGSSVGAVTSYSFTNVMATHTISATFAINTYTLTVSPGTGGTITVPSSSQVTVNYGAQTTITASPSTGYKFVNWTVTSGTGATIASPTSASTTVSLSAGPATVTANFQALTCSWTGVNDFSVTHNTPFSIATGGDTVDVGLQKAGVSQSTDDGTTWPAYGGTFGPGTNYVTAVAQYGNLTLAGTNGFIYPPGGIYASTDNGNTWIADTFSSANPAAVNVFYKTGATIYAGTSFGILVSTDNGTSWLSEQAYTSLTGSVSGIMVVGTGIYASDNGTLYYRLLNGYNWSSVSGAPSGIISLFMCGGTLFAGTNSGISMHDNSTGNWIAASNSGLATGVVGYAVSGNEIFAGTGSNGVYVSTDNGAHWIAVNGGLPSGGSTGVAGIASNSKSVFIISDKVVYESPLP